MFLSVGYLVSYFDRMLMVVVGELVKAEFHLSDKQLSLLTGASFVLIYGVCALGAGWLLDRHSRKRILIGSLALWSAMTMACGLAASFVQLAIARAGVGVGEAAITPAGLSMIGDLYRPARRPMATAIFFAGGMVGVMAAFLIGASIAEAYGWRATFLIAGPPGLLLALAMAFFCREPAREPLVAGAAASDAVNSFRLVWSNRPLVWLLAAGALSTFASTGMMLWLPMFFIRSHHMSLAHIGLFFGPVMAGGLIVGMLLGGWIGNRVAARSVVQMVRLCMWAMAAVTPLYLILLWTPSLPVALCLTFLTTAVTVVFTPISSAAWQTICDPRARGSAAGLSGFGAQVVGVALCPFLIGVMSDHLAPNLGAESLRYALMASTVFCIIGALLFGRSASLIARR